jgi:heme-degrading monooxygenase HmoA
MIARSWRGWTKSEDVDAYRKYVTDTWIIDCHAAEGNAGAHFLSRIVGDRAEIITLSFWNTEEALKRFFGGDPMVPHFYPDDDRYIIDGDPHVVHYQAD